VVPLGLGETSCTQVPPAPPHWVASEEAVPLVHRALQCPEPMSPKHVRAEPHTDVSLAQARPATVLPVGGTPASVGGGVPRVQTPLVQRSSEAQARPQTPQLRASVRVLAQPLLQSTCGAVQLGGAVQVPLTQVWPPVHARLQPPQWVALVRGSTQAPSQRVRGASQLGPVVTHWALWQTVPSVQAMPQPPQLALSLRTSTQARLHTTRGAGQSGGGSGLPVSVGLTVLPLSVETLPVSVRVLPASSSTTVVLPPPRAEQPAASITPHTTHTLRLSIARYASIHPPGW